MYFYGGVSPLFVLFCGSSLAHVVSFLQIKGQQEKILSCHYTVPNTNNLADHLDTKP